MAQGKGKNSGNGRSKKRINNPQVRLVTPALIDSDKRNARRTASASIKKSDPSDSRTPSQKDRDRLLYTSSLRRLAQVTQVVAADVSHVFHNRLTHSFQVAQVGRRLAERLLAVHSEEVAQSDGL